MKCVLPGVNIKMFGRAVHSLAKIGEDLYIEPVPAGVYFRTVNMARSAFASFYFERGFFSQYDDGLSSMESDSDDEPLKCKVALKGLLNAFKSLTNLEKTVERCKLTMDWEEAKLIIQLTCRYGIVKIFNIAFIECESLQAVYDKNTCTHHLSCASRVLCEAIGNFRTNQEEVTFCFSPDKAVFKTYVDEPDPSKVVHTVITLQPGEFEMYDISSDCEVTFCLKELKALLAFTDPVNLHIKADFSDPGCSNIYAMYKGLRRSRTSRSQMYAKFFIPSPMILTVENKPMFEGTFILATLSEKADTQTSNRAETARAKKSNANTNSRSSTSKTNDNLDNSSSDAILREEDSALRRHSKEISSISNKNNKRDTSSALITSNLSMQENMPQPQRPRPLSNVTDSTSPLHSNKGDSRTSPKRMPHRSHQNNGTAQMDVSLPNVSLPNRRGQDKNDPNETEMDDSMLGSPPAKKSNVLFRRCFESTFDPHSIPGYDVILAEDSDEDMSS